MNGEFQFSQADSPYSEEQLMFNELGMRPYESGEYEDGWVNIYSPTADASKQEWIFVTRREGQADEFFTLPIKQMTQWGPSEADRENLDRWLQQLFALYRLDTTDK